MVRKIIDYFRRYPATHFVVEESRSADIIKKFPALASADAVSPYWIRDYKYVLARISHLTGNDQASKYQPTDFEIGRLFMERKAHDSAVYYMERFRKEHPNNKSVLLALGKIYPFLGRVEEAEDILKKAISLYPRDYSVHLALGFYYHVRYAMSGDKQFLLLADETYQHVLNINPYQIDVINDIPSKIAGYK